jgi:glycerophosphoryl diester phosphodiesterase
LPPLLLTGIAGALIGLVSGNLPLLVVLLGATIMCWIALNVVVSAAVMGSFAFVLSGLYLHLGPHLSENRVREELTAPDSPVSRWSGTGITTAIVLAAAVATAAGLLLLRGIELEDKTLVIAHRGAAGAAPENTLAAIERALSDGADWVEIDVQESRDGEVVVVHDSDFMKLAGNPLKVWDGNLADIQQIDVGSWFGNEFADQRVPTLRRVLTTVRGRAKLVIELKYYGHDIALEQRVIDVVEAEDMADQVVLMSLKLEGVQKAKTLRPDWTVGLLAATAVGDLTRLDVDFLAVSAGLAQRGFVRRARHAGKPVFVWTVNDAISLSDWMSRGVAGVITDEPALAREVLAQRAQLTTGQRLILSTAGRLGKSRAPGSYRDQSP